MVLWFEFGRIHGPAETITKLFAEFGNRAQIFARHLWIGSLGVKPKFFSNQPVWLIAFESDPHGMALKLRILGRERDHQAMILGFIGFDSQSVNANCLLGVEAIRLAVRWRQSGDCGRDFGKLAAANATEREHWRRTGGTVRRHLFEECPQFTHRNCLHSNLHLCVVFPARGKTNRRRDSFRKSPEASPGLAIPTGCGAVPGF